MGKVKIAINGFGRIGRQVTKALRERYPETFDLVAVNDLGDVKTNAHLFKYDSNYGVYSGKVETGGCDILIDRDCDRVAVLAWDKPGVDLVIESTGLFAAHEKAAAKEAEADLRAALEKVIAFIFDLVQTIYEILCSLRAIADRLRELITQAFNFCGQRIKSAKCHAFLKHNSFPRSSSIFSLAVLAHAFACFGENNNSLPGDIKCIRVCGGTVREAFSN